MADHYQVIGVARGASGEQIRKSYLKLARERHPDRFSDPAEKAKAHEFFQALTEAFNTLSHPQRRREYDQELEKPKLVKPEDVAKDAYARALKRLEAGAEQEAVELLHVAIHHQPAEPEYHAALGRQLARHPKQAREAVLAFERAAQLGPQTLTHHLELAALLHAQGLKIRAKKALEPALKLKPDDPNVLRLADELGMGQPKGPEKPKARGIDGIKGLFGRKG